MKTILALTLLLLVLEGCNKRMADPFIPGCIGDKIIELSAKPKYNPPASITQFSYKGQTVYYITADCCDQFNDLFDSTCNLICHPDGGITGEGDRSCTDFNANKSNEKLIWKDPR